jgi:hypothetical protein
MPPCPVCLTEAQIHGTRGYSYRIECTRCGNFTLTDIARDDLPALLENKDEKRALLSHKICRSQINNRNPEWDYDTCENITNHHELPSIAEQIDGTLEWIGKRSEFFGHQVDVSSPSIEAFAGVLRAATTYHCLDTLATNGLIKFNAVLGGEHSGRAQLTAKGWQRYELLTKGSLSYDKAFMAMKFNDTELDNMVERHFKPAVLQTGYKLFKLDDRPQAGLIDIRIRQEIKASKFVIADLTHDNLGAYWEAGFAEGIGKKVIYTCKAERFEAAKTHFDVNHHLTIVWDVANPTEAVNNLKAAIRFTFPEAKQQD